MSREWVPVFLKTLGDSPNVSAACAAAGVSRMVAYDYRKDNEEFAALWEDALEQSTDILVGEAYRRACKGTRKPVFHQGAKCGVIREYSDTLAIFLLKAHRRDVYGERLDVTSGGKPAPIYMVEVVKPAGVD